MLQNILNPTTYLYNKGCQHKVEVHALRIEKTLEGTNRAYLIALIPAGIIEITAKTICSCFVR